MKPSPRMHVRTAAVLVAAVVLRGIVPAGYMPGSLESGLLFTLCPDGMPASFVAALAGGSAHGHHGADHQVEGRHCPIGHLLALAATIDTPHSPPAVQRPPVPAPQSFKSRESTPPATYRSRAPPA